MSSPPPGHSLREARHAADAHQRQLEAAHPRDPDLTDSNQITERMNRRPREPEEQVSKPGRAVSPALAVVVRGRRAAPRGVAAAACEVVESSARRDQDSSSGTSKTTRPRRTSRPGDPPAGEGVVIDDGAMVVGAPQLCRGGGTLHLDAAAQLSSSTGTEFRTSTAPAAWILS